MKPVISPKVELKWNWKEEQTFYGGYGKSSRNTQILYNKFAWKLRKKTSQTYNIQALWQQNKDLGMIFQANSQDELEKFKELQPNAAVSFISLLFQVLFNCLTLFSK